MKLSYGFKAYSLSLLVLICIFSCQDDDTEIVKMRVNHYVQPAMLSDMFSEQVLFVQKGDKIGSDEWEWRSAGIKGFDFELGYTYDLIVRVKHYDPPRMDANGFDYTLEKILSKTKVSDDTTFEITLVVDDWSSYVTIDDGSNFKTTNGTTIECGLLCDELVEKITALEGVSGVFKHVDSNTIRLIELE